MNCKIQKCEEDEILNNCKCEKFDSKNFKIQKIIKECENRLKNLKLLEVEKKHDKNKILNKKNKNKKDILDLKNLENQITELTNLYKDAQKKCRADNKNIINISINSKKEEVVEPTLNTEKNDYDIQDFVNDSIIENKEVDKEIKKDNYIPSYKDTIQNELKELEERYMQIKKDQALTDVEIDKIKSEEKLIKEKIIEEKIEDDYISKIKKNIEKL